MTLLMAIETSCDETAIAIVDDQRRIRGHVIASQIADHQSYGGVVPEIAARAHLTQIYPLAQECLLQAGVSWQNIDGFAATAGPGLIGGLWVGLSFAKGLAMSARKAFLAINHLEGHILTVRLTEAIDFPYLLLLVSGGHCMFVLVESLGCYHVLGQSIDDAPGEAFDKAARILGLDYPGGPAIEKCAQYGRAEEFTLPCPMKGRRSSDFSFSGLKTAIWQKWEKLSQGPQIPLEAKPYTQQQADLAAAFQYTVSETLCERILMTYQLAQDHAHLSPILKSVPYFAVAGGVGANLLLRKKLQKLAATCNWQFIAPPISLCTDNAAMIGWAAMERYQAGERHQLDYAATPSWPLSTLRPPYHSLGHSLSYSLEKKQEIS